MARGTKSLPAQEADAIRNRLLLIIKRDFDGNQKAAAKKLDVAQSAVNSFINGVSGPGMKILAAIADHEGTTYDDVLGRTPIGFMRDPLFPARGEAKGRLRGAVPDAALAFVDGVTRPEAADYSTYQWIVLIVQAAAMLNSSVPPALPNNGGTPPPKSRVRQK